MSSSHRNRSISVRLWRLPLFYNKAHHRRPHDGVLAAWADAMRAPANAPVVHGDKEKPELTRQYNEGYKTDLQNPMQGRGDAMK